MSKEKAEAGGQIIYPVPPKVWMGESYDLNTHALYRRTLAGKGLILGSSQPYKSVTKEIKSAPYKYADVTGDTFFDMYLNIIPGMHPFHWDLASMIVTAGAFGLGALDGIVDDEYVETKVKNSYLISSAEGFQLAQIANVIGSGMPKPSSEGNGGGSPTRPGRSPSSWFRREIDARGKGYSVKADGKKLNYAEHLRESGDSQEYIREMFAKGVKSLTFEAEGDKGRLDYSESYRSLS